MYKKHWTGKKLKTNGYVGSLVTIPVCTIYWYLYNSLFFLFVCFFCFLFTFCLFSRKSQPSYSVWTFYWMFRPDKLPDRQYSENLFDHLQKFVHFETFDGESTNAGNYFIAKCWTNSLVMFMNKCNIRCVIYENQYLETNFVWRPPL